MADWDPNMVSKKNFQKLLEEARAKAGSVSALGFELHINPRRIQRWLAGQGPSYPAMQREYVRLYQYLKKES